jgi:hypothetical protein
MIIESEKPPRGDEDTQRLGGAMPGNKKDLRPLEDYDHLGNVKLTEVTNHIFSALRKGEICRYGNTGWIMRCPQCGDIMILEDDTHKAFIARDGQYYRISPSLVCPNEACRWHVFAVIKPEDTDDGIVEIEIEEENAEGNLPSADAGTTS